MNIPTVLSRAPPCARLRDARMRKTEASTQAKKEGDTQTDDHKERCGIPGPLGVGEHPGL